MELTFHVYFLFIKLSRENAVNFEAIFDDKLQTVSAKNSKDDFSKHKAVKAFDDTVMEHHFGENESENGDHGSVANGDDDDEIEMTQDNSQRFICPLTKVCLVYINLLPSILLALGRLLMGIRYYPGIVWSSNAKNYSMTFRFALEFETIAWPCVNLTSEYFMTYFSPLRGGTRTSQFKGILWRQSVA